MEWHLEYTTTLRKVPHLHTTLWRGGGGGGGGRGGEGGEGGEGEEGGEGGEGKKREKVGLE